MANEFKITEIVDSKAFDQLTKLKSEFQSTAKGYAELAEKLAGGLRVKPQNYEELKNKSAQYGQVMKELAETQNKLASIQEEYKTTLKGIEEQTKKNVKAILEESKANKLNADAELVAKRAETERLKQQKLLNQESKKRRYTVEEGIAALNMEAKSIRSLKEQNKILSAARAEVDITTKKGSDTIKSFNKVIDRNNDLIKKNSDSLVRNKFDIGTYKESIKAAASEIAKGNISLKNMGNLAKGTGGYLKANMGAGLSEVRIGVGSMIKGMVGAQAVISGIQSLIGLFKSGIQSVIDFEAANSKLAAILGTTSKNIKDLTADAQRLGATTKYTASEATNLQIELAKLGFSRKEILQSTEGILKFAQATGSELPEAAALAGAALRMFNADTSETDRYVSAMAVATTKSALSFSYLQTAMPIAGSVAKTFGFEVEEVLALLGKLADAGIDASSAATATRNIFLNLANGGGKLNKAMGGNVRTLEDFVAGLKKVKDGGIELAGMLELTDKRSVNAFSNFVAGADSLLQLKESITGVTGELDDMAHTMEDNVKGAIAGLSSAWEALMLSFSGSNGPAKDFIDWVAKKIRQIAELLKDPEQRLGDTESEIELNSQKEVSSKLEQIELEHQIRIEQLRKQFRDKYLKEGKDKEVANANAIKDAQIQAAKEALPKIKELREAQKEIGVEDERALKNTRESHKQALKDWENTTFLGINWKNASAKLFHYETEEIKKVNKTFSDFANIKIDVSKTKAYNEGLDELIVKLDKIANPKDNNTKQLTDAEKKELEKQRREAEKAAKERLRIEQSYQQSYLDLMDEGLEKELAKIRLDYTKRIAAVKGGSEEEIKTRENLVVAMEDKLSDKIITYNQNKEKINLQNRLEALSTNSKEELDQKLSIQLQMNEILRETEIQNARKSGEDVAIIEDKYEKKRNDIIEKNILARIGIIEKDTSKETNVVKNAAEDNIREEELRYRKGEINEKQYRQNIYKITKDSIQEQLKLLNIQLQAELSALDPTDKKSDVLKEKIEKIKDEIRKLNQEIEDMAYDKAKSDRQDWADGFIDAISNMRSATEEYLGETSSMFSAFYNVIGKLTDQFVKTGDFSLSKWWDNLNPTEKASMILQSFAELFNGITSIVTSAFDSRIKQIEEEKEKNEEAGEEEEKRIEKLEENGAITSEEAEARKRAAKDKTEERNKELEKQKSELEQRQARWQKANSIIQTTIATSLAIMQAFAQAGPIAGAILAAVIGAMGAAQVAIIASQPIPKYAKGTDNHPGGLAIVGDGGKHEAIITDKGAYITPDVPTLVDIPKRAQVIPDLSSVTSHYNLKSDLGRLQREAKDKGEPITVNVNNDYRKLEVGIKELNNSFNELAKMQKKAARQADMRAIYNRL